MTEDRPISPMLLLEPPATTPTSLPSRIMSAVSSGVWSTAQRAMANILKLGPIPRHVGFIMDGNRRYAKKVGMHTMVGHMLGSKKLEETLEWCLKLGVQVVTVYAFSIENFKRPELEVSTLMDLARKKFEEFSKHSTFVAENSIRIRVLGDLSLLPPHVLDAARRAEYTTRNNSKATLNICFPYTSRHELASSMVLAVRGVREGYIEADDVGELLLDELMMTGDDPPLDVLVRTSGERRLSDFLLWQVTMPCQIHFLDVLWPEFTFWDMLPVLRSYQANYSRIRIERERISCMDSATNVDMQSRKKRIAKYKAKLAAERFEDHETSLNSENP